MAILCCLLAVGFAFSLVWAVGQYLTLEAVRFDLEEYVEDCRAVAQIADPRTKPHYTAVATVLSGVLSKYFGESNG
jgi:hypothetical protein